MSALPVIDLVELLQARGSYLPKLHCCVPVKAVDDSLMSSLRMYTRQQQCRTNQYYVEAVMCTAMVTRIYGEPQSLRAVADPNIICTCTTAAVGVTCADDSISATYSITPVFSVHRI